MCIKLRQNTSIRGKSRVPRNFMCLLQNFSLFTGLNIIVVVKTSPLSLFHLCGLIGEGVGGLGLSLCVMEAM